MMSIHSVREGVMGFSNVKSPTLGISELVDQVHRLVVSMGGYGVGKIGTGAVNELTGW